MRGRVPAHLRGSRLGGRWDRPELHRLLDHLREADTLVVWKLGRLSRSLKDMLHIMERIADAGAGFRSLTENIDTTTPSGRMMMQMIGSFAEFERATTRSGQLSAPLTWFTAFRREAASTCRSPLSVCQQQRKPVDRRRPMHDSPALAGRVLSEMRYGRQRRIYSHDTRRHRDPACAPCSRASAPSLRCAVRNSVENLSPTNERDPQVKACDKHVRRSQMG